MALIAMIIMAWLGSMFVYSAGLKIAHYDTASSLIKPYRVLPPRIGVVAGLVLPFVELLTGILLLLGFLFPTGPMLGVILGITFAYASFRVLRRGANIPCGCAGATQDRVTWTTFIRALFITAASL